MRPVRPVRRLRFALVATGLFTGVVGAVLPAGPAAAAPTCAQGGECVLGDIGPGGGVVFFVKGIGAFNASRFFPDTSYDCVQYDECYDNTVSVTLTAEQQAALPFEYLEVAPASAETLPLWTEGQGNVPGATGQAIGTGSTNTEAIAAAFPGPNASTDALAYTGGSRSDWFLPSYDELALILVREAVDGTAMGTFAPNQWSSTQSDPTSARGLYFPNGQALWVTKNTFAPGARPVRAFSPAPPPPTTTTTTGAPTTTTEPPATTTTITTAAPSTTSTAPAPPLTEERAASLPTQSIGAPTEATVGQTIEVHATGFTPGATIEVYVASAPVLLGRAVADETGAVTLTVTLPAELRGAHSLVLYDPASDAGVRQAIQIEAVDELAFTGSRVVGMLALSLFLIAAGLATIPWERRRRAGARA